MDIVPQFQKKYNLQVVNTVFLTDGGADSINGVYMGDDLNPHSATPVYGKKLIVRDPVTRYEVESGIYRAATTSLLKLLKKRTNANVVGFYLLGKREIRNQLISTIGFVADLDTKVKQFKREKYVVVDNSGYDEYYFMLSEYVNPHYAYYKHADDEDDDLDVEVGASNRKLLTAFTKYNSGRFNDRVVLNKFVGMIA